MTIKRLSKFCFCRHLLQRSLALLVVAAVLSNPVGVAALTNAQQNLLRSGVHYFDIAGSDCSQSSASSTTLTGNDNVEKAWNYFKSKGLSDMVTAAIVGNFRQESSLNPTIMEKGGNSQNPADADSGVVNGKPATGWGIAQWSPGSKVIGIAHDLNVTGPIYELSTQLDIVYAEMQGSAPTGYQNVLGGMQKLSDLPSMVEFFRANFESGTMGNRQQYAQDALAQYGNKGDGTSAVTGAAAPSGCASTGAVSCTTPTTSDATQTGGLSSLRQNVVCLTEAEYTKYENGEMKRGTDFYKYSENHDEEWCADFASWIYNQAGYPIGDTGNGRVAYVPDLRTIGQKNQKFTYHTVDNYTPVPGDLAIHIYPSGGHHVNIVVSVNTNKHSMVVIGGNEDGITTANTTSRVNEDTYSSYNSDSIVGFVSPKE